MYSSVRDLKIYLGITVDADDTLLTALIKRAQGIIDNHCKRTFEASADTTRYLDCPTGQGGRLLTDYQYGQRRVSPPTLWLDKDLCQIASIVNGDGVTVTAGQYITQPVVEKPFYAIRLKASSGVNWTYTDEPTAAIAITGRWAYSVTAPQPIIYACERLAAYLYRKRDAQVFDDTAFAEGGVVRLPKGLPVDVMEILNKHVRRVAIA